MNNWMLAILTLRFKIADLHLLRKWYRKEMKLKIQWEMLLRALRFKWSFREMKEIPNVLLPLVQRKGVKFCGTVEIREVGNRKIGACSLSPTIESPWWNSWKSENSWSTPCARRSGTSSLVRFPNSFTGEAVVSFLYFSLYFYLFYFF